MEKSNKVIGILVFFVLGTALAGSYDLPGPAPSDVEMQIAWPQEAHVLAASGDPPGCVAPPQERIFIEGFEAGWGDWWSDLGVWEVGTPTSGPNEPHSGTQCAATVLAGKYGPYQESRLVSPSIQLPTVEPGEEILLRFYDWWSYSSLDGGDVEVQTYNQTTKTWSNWKATDYRVYSYSGLWHHARVDLTNYTSQLIRIGFHHSAFSGSQSWGWYVDDVEIVKQAIPVFSSLEGFECGWGGWWSDLGVWEIGAPTSGPNQARSGTQCAATVLAGKYGAYDESRLVSPSIQLPTVEPGEEILLRFYDWWSYSSLDGGDVEVQTYNQTTKTWSNWKATDYRVYLYSGLWHHARVDLTNYTSQLIRIGFHHSAFSGYQDWGWYIDDVEIILPTSVVRMKSWSLSEDTGIDPNDKLTSDTTPTLAFVFTKPVQGANTDIQITAPDGTQVALNPITGWGSDTVVVTLTAALTKDGRYTVTLKGTIRDNQGHALNGGTNEIVYFTLDTKPPVVRADPLVTGDTTPALTGTIDDPDAEIVVTVDGWDLRDYTAVNNRNGTWTLRDDTITPALAVGAHDVIVFATDKAGNVGFDVAVDGLVVSGLRISYRQMRFDPQSGQDSVEVLVTNTSALPIGGRIWLVVKAISDPSVTLAVFDGVTDDGHPYINLTAALHDGQLHPDESVIAWLTFNNPQQKPFMATVLVRVLP